MKMTTETQPKRHTSICIVWPAYFSGSTDRYSHVTALFLGKTGGRFAKAHPQLRASLESYLEQYKGSGGFVPVERLIHMGYHQNIPALGLFDDGDHLRDIYERMRRDLVLGGVPIDATYVWTPHVTIKNEQQDCPLPKVVDYEAPVLWWGENRPIHSKHAELLKAEAAK